jgi:membrane protein required for colicin V production
LSPLDIVLVIIFLGGAYGGYKDGFILSLFSLIAIVLGLLGGFKLMGWTMVFLADQYNVDQKVLPYLAFALVFLIIVISVSLLGRLIKVAVNKSLLGQFDQIIGALLGVIKIGFMISIALWISDSLKINFPERWIANSWLHPITASFAPKIADWIGDILPVFKDIF